MNKKYLKVAVILVSVVNVFSKVEAQKKMILIIQSLHITLMTTIRDTFPSADTQNCGLDMHSLTREV